MRKRGPSPPPKCLSVDAPPGRRASGVDQSLTSCLRKAAGPTFSLLQRGANLPDRSIVLVCLNDAAKRLFLRTSCRTNNGAESLGEEGRRLHPGTRGL